MTASATVTEFFTACRRLDAQGIVALFDSSYLERWRRSQLFTLAVWCDDVSQLPPSRDHSTTYVTAHEWSSDQLGELLTRHALRDTPLLPGIPLGELAQWPAAVLMRRLLEAAIVARHKPPPSEGEAGPRVIGEIAENDRLFHVLCRSHDGEDQPDAVEVFTLRRHDGAWRILVPPLSAEVHLQPELPPTGDRGPLGAPAA